MNKNNDNSEGVTPVTTYQMLQHAMGTCAIPDLEKILINISKIGLDIDDPGPDGNTVLYAVTYVNNKALARLLLKYGANRNKQNIYGQSPFSIDPYLFEGLDNESRAISHNKKITEQQEAYAFGHKPRDLHSLQAIANEYADHDTVTRIKSIKDALMYIQDGVYYMTYYSFEMDKIHESPNAVLNHGDRLIVIMKVISACARYIRKNHHDITQRTPGIDWESLALFMRIEQYNPSFVTSMPSSCSKKLMHIALHDIIKKGEFEHLRVISRFLQRDPNNFQYEKLVLSRFSRLYNFFHDEYTAQFIEDAAKNWTQNNSILTEADRAKLLRNIMIAGEALNDSSQIVKGIFDEVAVGRIISARNILCHPERSHSKQVIEAILNGDVESIDNQLILDMNSLHAPITKYLERYKNDLTPEEIWDHINNVPLAPTPIVSTQVDPNNSIPTKGLGHWKHEYNKFKNKGNSIAKMDDALQEIKMIAVKIPKNLSNEEIREVKEAKYFLAEEELTNNLKALGEKVDQVDSHKPNKMQEFRAKLKAPSYNIENIKKSLTEMEGIQGRINKGEYVATEKENKQLSSYNNLKDKLEIWEDYAKQKKELEEKCNSLKETADIEYKASLIAKEITVMSAFIECAAKVQSHYHALSQTPLTNSLNYTSRGFSSHPDHSILEFYQVMVGSYARYFLEDSVFCRVAPKALLNTLEDVAKPSRGYLAHNSARIEGESFVKSKDRSEVFGTNSKKIIEAIPALREVWNELNKSTMQISWGQYLAKGVQASQVEHTRSF